MRRSLAISGAALVTLVLAVPTAGALSPPPDIVSPIAEGPAARATTAGSAAAAGGAVSMGQIAAAGYAGVCGGNNAIMIQSSSGPDVAYTVPGAGVITSASYYATPQVTGSLRVMFAKPGAGANQWDIVDRTPLLLQTPGGVNTWPLRIPVPAETRLGLFMPASNVACNIPSMPGDEWSIAAGQDPLASTVNLTTQAGVRINIAAVWEPDVDGDDHGDVSQDACPQSASSQAVCTPELTVTKAPKKKSTKRKATIKFVSSLAGSTFTCTVDKKQAKPCASPFRKKYKYGRHKVVITAIGPTGVPDPTPATVRFKVKRPS